MRRWLRRRWVRWTVGILGVGLILGIVDYWAYPALATPEGKVVDHGENGLWLRYRWYFGEQTDFDSLADRLQRFGMRDAYFHVRSIQADGTLKYRHEEDAKRLNQELKQRVPAVRRIAWIYAGNRAGRGEVRLSDPKVRAKMVAEADWLVHTAGFDGVQWDYEICNDGDPHLLRLLEETRAALPKGAFLGAAVPTWFPPPISSVGWSEEYFGEVAKRCDQLAVMVYDTAAYTPRLYQWLMAQQVVRVTNAVARAHAACRVIAGVPTYADGTASHNPHAENLRIALMGIRDGLASGANLDVWQGVGIFADYTTDNSEWDTYGQLWQRPTPPAKAAATPPR